MAGRAGFRAEAGPAFSLRGYVEESIWQMGGLEVTGGLDLRWPPGTITPYTAAIWEGDGYWVAVELAKPIPGDVAAFRIALMGGVAW